MFLHFPAVYIYIYIVALYPSVYAKYCIAYIYIYIYAGICQPAKYICTSLLHSILFFCSVLEKRRGLRMYVLYSEHGV